MISQPSREQFMQHLLSFPFSHQYRFLSFLFHSGIGLYAAKLLACINPRNRLILVARTQEKAEDAKEEILSVLRRGNISIERSRLVCIACEHCSLDSVRQFSHNLRELLALETNTNNTCTRSSNGDYYYERHGGIDVMCLNAGAFI